MIAFAISDDDAETVQMHPPRLDDTIENVIAPIVDTMVVPPDQIEHVFVEPGSPEAAAVTSGSRSARPRECGSCSRCSACSGSRLCCSSGGSSAEPGLEQEPRTPLSHGLGLLTAVGSRASTSPTSRDLGRLARRMPGSSSPSSSPRILLRGHRSVRRSIPFADRRAPRGGRRSPRSTASARRRVPARDVGG